MGFFKSLFGRRKPQPEIEPYREVSQPAPEPPVAAALPSEPAVAAAAPSPGSEPPSQPQPLETAAAERVKSAVEPDPKRLKRVSQSLLENEALTADLDDAAAGVALDWALDCARRIVSDTAGMDEAQAEEAMSPRLKGLRKLLRSAAKWAAVRGDAAALAELLPGALEQAALVYGKRFETPLKLPPFSSIGEDATAALNGLRELIESLNSD